MRMTRRAMLAAAALLTVAASAADAKSYKAELFDSRIQVLPGGALEVTESIQFRFDDGPFTQVFREMPTRRTGGIEILRAEIDGDPVAFGDGPGRAEVRRQSNRVRVVWRFEPVEYTTKRFVLRYRVADAVRRESGHDSLAWRATPGEHAYAIDEAAIEYQLPAALAAPPLVDVERAPAPEVTATGTRVRVSVRNVRSNGWIETKLRFPEGAVITAPPAWQQHQLRVQAGARNWLVGAAIVFVAGFVLLLAWRQSYDRPPGEVPGAGASAVHPPDTLSPAAAGALVNSGHVNVQQAMGTLVGLADRGVLEIIEEPRGIFGQRAFTLRRRDAAAQLTPAEQGALDAVFVRADGKRDTVSLSRAQAKFARSLRVFRAGVEKELSSQLLLDPERKALQRRYVRGGVVLLIAGVAAFAAAGLLVPNHGGWALLIPAAIIAVAVLAFIFAGTITPLSNEGLRRAAQWRRYRNHLRSIATEKTGMGLPDIATTLPFAVALGAGTAWAKYLRKHPAHAPPWFRAVSTSDDGAFAAFVASSGAHAGSGGGGASASGAAGGGASGAS
jgi:hypothetical protein